MTLETSIWTFDPGHFGVPMNLLDIKKHTYRGPIPQPCKYYFDPYSSWGHSPGVEPLRIIETYNNFALFCIKTFQIVDK